MTRRAILLATLGVGLLGVGPAAGPAADPEKAVRVEADRELEGTVTEARLFFLTRSTARKHDFTAFMGLKANLPAVLVTAAGEPYYLVAPPRGLAELAGKAVRVRGALLPAGRLLRPERWWVKTESGWEELPK